MNPKEHREDFNRRWNITSQESYQQSFYKFKQRILNIFKNIDTEITEDSIFNFCQYYGIPPTTVGGYGNRPNTIINRVSKETDKKEFYKLIEVITTLYIEFKYPLADSQKYDRIEQVKKAIEESYINVAIIQNTQGNIILYPKGEKKLDDELVNKTLSFLNTESNKHFEDALKLYQSKNFVKSAESLRRSLEEFLRYKLENEKGLEKNIELLQKQLKVNNTTSEARNIIFQTFKYLDKYFNEHSKHKDGNISEDENEFLIYQTGVLMRYINQHNFKQDI